MLALVVLPTVAWVPPKMMRSAMPYGSAQESSTWPSHGFQMSFSHPF